jgi:hypothetical protein
VAVESAGAIAGSDPDAVTVAGAATNTPKTIPAEAIASRTRRGDRMIISFTHPGREIDFVKLYSPPRHLSTLGPSGK